MGAPYFVESASGIYDWVGGGIGDVVRFSDSGMTLIVNGTLQVNGTANIGNITGLSSLTGGGTTLAVNGNTGAVTLTGTQPAAANPGTAATTLLTVTAPSGGNALSGVNNGGNGGSLVFTAGAPGTPLGGGIGLAGNVTINVRNNTNYGVNTQSGGLQYGQFRVFATDVSTTVPILYVSGNGVVITNGALNPTPGAGTPLWVKTSLTNPTATVQGFASETHVVLTGDTAQLIQGGVIFAASDTSAYSYNTYGIMGLEVDAYAQSTGGTIVNLIGVQTNPQTTGAPACNITNLRGFQGSPSYGGTGTVTSGFVLDGGLTLGASGGATDGTYGNMFGARIVHSINASAATPSTVTQAIGYYFGGMSFGGSASAKVTTVTGVQIATLFNIRTNTSITGGFTTRAVYVEALGTQGGNTSGTDENYGFLLGASVGGASALGGTVNNYGALLRVASATAAGTNNNYGLRVTGNGGSGGTSNNWAIWADSTANSAFAGAVGIGATSAPTASSLTLADGWNVVVGTGTGTQIGTTTGQKLGFYGAAAVAQIAGATDALAWAVTLGFRAASVNPPLNLGSGAVTCGALTASGQVLVADGTNVAPSVAFSNDAGVGWYRAGSQDARFASGSADRVRITNGFLLLTTAHILAWGSTGVTGADVNLVRDAANVLAMRNATSAQQVSIYNTFTDASNYERLEINWIAVANTLTLRTTASGTGTVRALALTGGTISLNASVNANVNLCTGTSSGTLALGGTSATVNLGTKLAQYNNVNTAGWGVPAIYAAGRPAQQTNATVTLATYTVGVADGSFEVSANINVTVSTTVTMTVTCSYTDETNVARVLTLPFTLLAGTAVAAITTAQGNVPYEGMALHLRAKAGTTITIATAGTVTAVTYTGEGIIKQMA